MKATGRWLLCALVATYSAAAGPSLAVSLVCTSLGDFDWLSVDDTSVSNWDCADADSPGADDHFVIDHAVTVLGDILQDGATPGTGLTVRGGGSLTADGAIVLSLNDEGLSCNPGASCSFHGAYRQFSTPTPMLLEEPDPAASFIVGDVIPCPTASGTSDCSDPTRKRLVRLDYPSDTYGPGAPREIPHVCDAIAEIAAGDGEARGDVLAFWNPDPLDLQEGPDTHFWYEIEDVTTGSSCSIDFNVHQGVADQAGYPLARREIAAYSPRGPILVGDRVVEFPASTLPAPDFHDGRMLRFERNGAPSNETYRIYDTRVGATDECADSVGPCDLLKLADHRGVARGVDASSNEEDEVWIDYGWQSGDPFLVLSPVRIEAAAPARKKTSVELRGDLELRGVVFYRTSTVIVRAESIGQCRDVWLEDLFSGDSDKLTLLDGFQCERLSITGGDADSGQDTSHAIVAATSEDITLRALGLRHGGDDYFSVRNFFAPHVTFDRFRGQFKSTNAPSDECISTGNSPITVELTDIECIDASNTGGTFGPAAPPGTFEAQSVILIASRRSLWGSALSNADAIFTDVTIIGSQIDGTNADLLPVNADRFVVRDSDLLGNGRLLRGPGGYLRNGIAMDNRIASSLALTPGDVELTNVAIVRTSSVAPANALVSVITAPSSTQWHHVLFYQPPGTSSFGRTWHFRSSLSDLSAFTLGGVAFAGSNRALENQSGIALDDVTSGVHFNGPLCFFDNGIDVAQATVPELPAGSLLGVDPEFVSPDENRFDVAAGSPWDVSGCGVLRGAQAPGVRAFQRYHSWSNLAPEFMGGGCLDGVDNDGDGWVDFPEDDGCSSPEDDTETAACSDSIDNDGDGLVDWNGAGIGEPDPECGGLAGGLRESPRKRCGLGAFALVGVAGLLCRTRSGAQMRQRRAALLLDTAGSAGAFSGPIDS